MYCSKRNCYNELFMDENNDLELCLDHYKELQEKIAKEKRHTVENCFCGKNHLTGKENEK